MAVWALIGFMGCGKSSIGRLVASLSDIQFIDLDDVIASRTGRSIPDIFRSAGEAGFRAIERETLASLLAAGIPPSGVRFAHPTTPLGRSPRYRTAGVTSLSGGSQPPIDILLSLGGGTLTDEGSRELVKKNCKCIYLRASVQELAKNLREDGAAAGRPMLAGANPDAPADAPDSLESCITAMMAVRGPIYEKAADIILDIDGLDYSDVARQILNSFSR